MSRLDSLISRPSARTSTAVLSSNPSQTKPMLQSPGFIVYPEVDERRSERFVPPQCAVSLTLANGEKRDARITNVSRYSISVLADFTQIPMDRVAKIGKMPVKPVRRFPGGAIFNFIEPLEARVTAADFSA